MEKPLTDKQQAIAGGLIQSFRKRYNGPSCRIKSTLLLSNIRNRGYTIGEAELRLIIADIRRKDLMAPGFILSDQHGYWYSEDADEMKRVWTSERRRAIQILKNFRPLSRRFKTLTDNPNLFTNQDELHY